MIETPPPQLPIDAANPNARAGTAARLLTHFIVHPLKLILSNASVLVVFFVVLLFNFVTQGHKVVAPSTLGHWTFETLPATIAAFLQKPSAVVVLVVLFLAKTVLGTVVAQEMMAIYQHERRGLWSSLRSMKATSVLWFLGAEVLVYVVFGLVALVAYVPAYLLWHRRGVSLVALLVILFAIFYPLFYICFSVTSMVAVLPLRHRVRLAKLRYLATAPALVKMWAFYTLRLSAEAVLLFVVPFIAVRLWNSYLLATISAGVGLMVPFALLRGSSYELKLDLLRGDADIDRLFALHYADMREGRYDR